MQNGIVYRDSIRYSCLPFTEIKEFNKDAMIDWNDEEYERLPGYSKLYVIEAKKKRELTLIEMFRVESIIFDPTNTFNSVSEYALIERTDDVPLVVPSASILIEQSMINHGEIKHYFEIPFINEAAVLFKSILSMKVTKVLHVPDHTKDWRCHIEVTVTKRNTETISDEIHGVFALLALTRKGLMKISCEKIKKITFM